MSNMNMGAAAGAARQKMQESSEDRETRRAGNFSDFEKTMPYLTSRFDCSLTDKLTSYLGGRNPFYKTVDPDKHVVWLFDNTANRANNHSGKHGEGHWQAEFVAAYFLKNSGKDLSKIVADIAEKVGLGEGDEAEATIAKRLEPFADAIAPAHAVNVSIGEHQTRRLGPSTRDGISNDVLKLPSHKFSSGRPVHSDAIGVSAWNMQTHFAEPTGWAVISDVDDTIKRTMTSSPGGILRTTFVDEPQPIAGMPEFYAYLNRVLESPPFWYLSASPYNLYPFLRNFRHQYYPAGTLVLREASWMSLAGLLTNLTQGTQAYKVDRLQKIHDAFPKRKFVLIGDSTQTDPESYGVLARKYPEWVGRILIRKVTGIAEMDESDKNKPERFEKAFDGVPAEKWMVFEDPKELYDIIEGLLRE